MSEQDFIVREIFAYFGRTMYLAQSVEKGFMNVILMEQHSHQITETRYDELLAELSTLTFGQLKRKIKEISHFTADDLALVEQFHKKRDFLAHSYWWERSVEFYDDSLQHKLLIELDEITVFFESVNELIKKNISPFTSAHSIDLEELSKVLVSQGETIPLETFRELNKNENVKDLFGYKNAPQSQIPIFQLEDNTHWTICEFGLSQYKFEIKEEVN